MQLRTLGIVVFGFVGAGVGACTSGSTSFGSTSSGGFSSAGASGPGAVPPPEAFGPDSPGACPSSAPPDGKDCPFPIACEYGEKADPACNVIAKCDGSSWSVEKGTSCPTTCPKSWDTRVPGEVCSDTAVCTYLEATCGCAGARAPDVDGGDGGDGGDGDAGADSGADGGAMSGNWKCVRPGNGCPARRPVSGTSCLKDITCDYGSCLFGATLTFECNGNRWIEKETSCP